MWCGLVETLAEKDRQKPDVKRWVREYCLCFLVLKRDYLLMQVWFAIFLLCVGIGGVSVPGFLCSVASS